MPEKHLLLLHRLAKAFDFLKDVGIPDHFTCLLGDLYAGQEATVRTGRETMNWFKIGKGVHQGCVLSPCLFNFYAVYIKQDPIICSLQRDPLDSKTQIV